MKTDRPGRRKRGGGRGRGGHRNWGEQKGGGKEREAGKRKRKKLRQEGKKGRLEVTGNGEAWDHCNTSVLGLLYPKCETPKRSTSKR